MLVLSLTANPSFSVFFDQQHYYRLFTTTTAILNSLPIRANSSNLSLIAFALSMIYVLGITLMNFSVKTDGLPTWVCKGDSWGEKVFFAKKDYISTGY